MSEASEKSEGAAADKFLDETIDFWQPLVNRPLSREDARQIRENLTGFFRLLRQWQEVETARVQAAPADGPADKAA